MTGEHGSQGESWVPTYTRGSVPLSLTWRALVGGPCAMLGVLRGLRQLQARGAARRQPRRLLLLLRHRRPPAGRGRTRSRSLVTSHRIGGMPCVGWRGEHQYTMWWMTWRARSTWPYSAAVLRGARAVPGSRLRRCRRGGVAGRGRLLARLRARRALPRRQGCPAPRREADVVGMSVCMPCVYWYWYTGCLIPLLM